MAYNTLSGTVIGPNQISAKLDGTFTHVTGTFSGSYINAEGAAVSFATIGTEDGGTIGAAEDGAYTDGLFSDFTSGTLIGVPVDRYNELFKSLVPPPAAFVNRADAAQDGTDAYLSFGASNNMSSDSPAYISVGTTAGFSAVDKGGLYQTDTAGNNFRRSIFKLDTNITGDINFHVTASVLGSYTNYTAKAFGNAEAGSLQLYVNSTSTAAHTLNLATATGAGNPGAGSSSSLNSDGSGFTNISVSSSATDANNNSFPIFQHRTAKFIINSGSQRRGWNYAFIKHTVGSANYTTNYVEWVNDDNSTNVTITSNSLTNISLVGSRYLSGVHYNTSATANYQFLISNFYKNVYTLATVTCTDSTSNASIANTTMPHIGGSDENKTAALTQSLTTTDLIILNEAIGATASVTHAFKGSATGKTNMSGFLIYTPSVDAATAVAEYFKEEATWRLPSSSYASQGATVTGSWNSQTHMTGSGTHADGLQIYNQRLVSPKNTTNGGNFSTIANTPSGNPNYSGISGTRTFYRAFKNSGAAKQDVSIVIKGSATIVSSGASLGANANIRVLVKTPGKTGWMNLASNFSYNNVSDGSGANELGLDATVDGAGAVNVATLGDKVVATGEYFLVKIEADDGWTGNITEISVTFGAGTGSITNPSNLSRIDETTANNGSNGKLSFGSSKGVTDYTNVGASPSINGAVDINEAWSVNTGLTNERLGIYNKTVNIEAKLNSAISSARISDGDTGDLKIFVNGVQKHLIDLSSFGSGNGLNGAGSGFTSVSAVQFPTFSNNVHDYSKPYRTGSLIAHNTEQRNGWNFVQVIHSGAFGERTTSYIEWINDNDDSSISTTGGAITNFAAKAPHYHSSGIKFFSIAPSASFTLTSANNYKNVYDDDSSDAIDFNDSLTNVSISALTASGTGIATTTDANGVLGYPALNTEANSQNQVVNYNVTLNFTPSTSLRGGFVGGSDKHTASIAQVKFLQPPFNGNNNTYSTFNSGDFTSFSKSGFLRLSASDTSTTATEHFTGESYRLENKNVNYTTQANITGGSYDWDSQKSVNDNGNHPNYSDGLVVFDGKLIAPPQAGVAGDCRNTSEGGSLQSPASNVNYSIGVLTTGIRTYVRSFRNTSGGSKSSATVTVYGSGSMEDVADALGNGKFTIEVKFPSTNSSVNTAWLDAGSPYTSNNRGVDGAGAYVGDASNLPLAIAGGGTAFSVTFNGGSWINNEYLLLRVRASASWDGYIDRIDVG